MNPNDPWWGPLAFGLAVGGPWALILTAALYMARIRPALKKRRKGRKGRKTDAL